VVIPTRNRPELLARALARVLAQRHALIEVIVVDDGSTPANHQHNLALQRDAAPRVRILHLPDATGTGAGPSQARNTAMAHAQGEFIAFCDDDDEWIDEDHLSVAVDAFRRHPNLDLYFCNQIAKRDGQVEFDVWLPLLHHALGQRRLATGQAIVLSRAEALGAPGDFAHMNTCVIRRELLTRTGDFWAETRYVEDLDMFVRWADQARELAYNPHVATQHHIPNRKLRASASTRLSMARKHATIHMVAGHLLRTCGSAEAASYARVLGRNACNNLSVLHRKERRTFRAFCWASLALAWRCRMPGSL
jgi:glycosyltransferase involved in cell wall biosynthesis